jgi:hypothetical protein
MGLDGLQQFLKTGPFQGASRDAAIIIGLSDQFPANPGLALDIGFAGLDLPWKSGGTF